MFYTLSLANCKQLRKCNRLYRPSLSMFFFQIQSVQSRFDHIMTQPLFRDIIAAYRIEIACRKCEYPVPISIFLSVPNLAICYNNTLGEFSLKIFSGNLLLGTVSRKLQISRKVLCEYKSEILFHRRYVCYLRPKGEFGRRFNVY